MTLQGNPEAVPFLLAAAVAGAVAALAWSRRQAPGGWSLLTMMVGEAGWAAFEAAELLIADLPLKLLCFQLRACFAVLTIAGLMSFVLRHTGQARWLRPWRFAAVCAPMVVPLALSWTNSLHHLYWADLRNQVMTQAYGAFLIAMPRYGPVFWIHFGYAYLLLAVASALLADATLRSTGDYRMQSGLMLFGVTLPWVINVVDMSRLFGFIHVDTAVLGFAVTGLTLLPGLYRFGLLDLVPIAREAIVRGMLDPVVVLDPKGRVAELNPAAFALTRVSEGRAIGQPAGEVLADWPELALRLADDREDPSGDPFELAGPSEAAGRRFEGRVSWLEDDEGRPTGRIVVLRDVTERAARIEAEATVAAREQFLAMLSHELRNPLMPILAGVEEILADPAVPPGQRSTLEMILRNAGLEARLIEDLLDVTRIHNGRLHMIPRLIDAHEPIRHALEVCLPEARAKSITLDVDLATEDSHVVFDPARLEQVAWNLLRNAVKFTPPGGRVSIRTRARGDQSDPRLAFEVADTGIGIDPVVLPRIFEPFEQGGDQTGRKYGGLGLGLAICRTIVEAHGGRIEGESPGPGGGAMFRVVLETSRSPAAATPPDPLALAKPGAVPPSLRVLLVEDNADTRAVLVRLLRLDGFAIEGAGDVRSAIEMAASGSFDVVVTDLGLPDGSGYDLLRAVRDRCGESVAGIVVSGHGREEDVERSRKAGFAEHLIKPVPIRDLRESILRVAGVGA